MKLCYTISHSKKQKSTLESDRPKRFKVMFSKKKSQLLIKKRKVNLLSR